MTDGEILDDLERLTSETRWESGLDGPVDARGIAGFAVTADGIKRATEIGITAKRACGARAGRS